MAKELSTVLKVAHVDIGDLKEYERNSRSHPKSQIDLLIRNIERFGFTTPVLIDAENTVIAGHGRVIALRQMGITKVPVVRMDQLTRSEANALRLADNKLAEMAEWDTDLLVEDLGELPDDLFDLTGFDKDLLIGPEEKDDIIPTDAPTRAKSGDLWALGPHRVLCGDSTDSKAVSRLMGTQKADLLLTDPPYNVDYTGKTKKKLKVENDKQGDASYRAFLVAAITNAASYLKAGGGILYLARGHGGVQRERSTARSGATGEAVPRVVQKHNGDGPAGLSLAARAVPVRMERRRGASVEHRPHSDDRSKLRQANKKRRTSHHEAR